MCWQSCGGRWWLAASRSVPAGAWGSSCIRSGFATILRPAFGSLPSAGCVETSPAGLATLRSTSANAIQRTSTRGLPGPAGPADIAVALSVLGRTDGAPFGSVEALRRCTAAHLVPVEVVIVGSGRILVDGTGAAAILLSTGVAGRFDALIVGLDCDLGNPALISRGIVGG